MLSVCEMTFCVWGECVTIVSQCVCVFIAVSVGCVLAGSDGREYQFLLKGHEDLRQDERVMQLFGLVNSLLKDNAHTFRRNLTYVRRGFCVSAVCVRGRGGHSTMCFVAHRSVVWLVASELMPSLLDSDGWGGCVGNFAGFYVLIVYACILLSLCRILCTYSLCLFPALSVPDSLYI